MRTVVFIAGTMTTKAEILQKIRIHCLNCCDGSPKEVNLCSAYIPPDEEHNCVLHPLRFGTDPNPNKKKVEQGKKTGFQKGSTE